MSINPADSKSRLAAAEVAGVARMPRHVGIIMDGNGRWAAARGLPRQEGHRRGTEALRRIVRHAGEKGVEYLTLFSFSSENWSRSDDEIQDLMNLLRRFIRKDLEELVRNNVHIRIIGSRDGLQNDILHLLQEAESRTRENTGLTLMVAFNYGGRDEIIRATRCIAEKTVRGEIAIADITESLMETCLDTAGVPDPDLIIRTSGEMRISNFLLWQSAYTEFVFVQALWPEFNADTFDRAIHEYSQRERRFGARANG